MSRDDLESLAGQGGDGLGCEPFGHLASPFVDGELAPAELERFDTHLGGCTECRQLVAEYRSLDALAAPRVPAPAEADWGRCWEAVKRTVAEDRAKAGSEPLAPVLDAVERLGSRPAARRLRPLLYLAASVALVAVLLAVQRSSQPVAPQRSVQTASAEPSLSCQEPDYVPVAYTIGDGDDAVSVMYCAFVGADT